MKLNNGVLPQVDIAYETWGELNDDKSNVVVIHTGLSPSSHAKSHKVCAILSQLADSYQRKDIFMFTMMSVCQVSWSTLFCFLMLPEVSWPQVGILQMITFDIDPSTTDVL